MKWLPIIEAAAEYAECTPLRARRAWRAAARAWKVQDGMLHSWVIAGLGTLRIRGGNAVGPEETYPVEGGFVKWVFCIPFDPDWIIFDTMHIVAEELQNRLASGWSVNANFAFSGNIPTEPYPHGPKGLWATAGYAEGEDPPPFTLDGKPPGILKIRMNAHLGVIVRHRAGDI